MGKVELLKMLENIKVPTNIKTILKQFLKNANEYAGYNTLHGVDVPQDIINAVRTVELLLK